MSERNLSFVRGIYDAFNEGDMPAVLSAMDPSIEWREAEHFPYADGNPYVGPDAVVEGVFSRIDRDWEGWSAVPDEMLDAGDSVVVLGRYLARHGTTGAELDAQFAHVLWLEDGRVTRFQQYTDTAAILQATGTALHLG